MAPRIAGRELRRDDRGPEGRKGAMQKTAPTGLVSKGQESKRLAAPCSRRVLAAAERLMEKRFKNRPDSRVSL